MRRRELLVHGAAALAARAAPALAGEAAARAGLLRRYVQSELSSLDPQAPTGMVTTEMAAELFEGLTAFGADGQVGPGCARSWRTSDDGLRWSFELRPALRWSDGAPLTARDFVLALRRFVTPGTGAGFASRLDAIRGARELRLTGRGEEQLGVAARDERTLTIDLVHPEPQLPLLLAPVYCVPAHLIARSARDWAHPQRIVSNGPYALESWAPGAKIVKLRRNERFHSLSSVRIERVEWYTGYDATSRLRLFRLGQCDLTPVEDAVTLATVRRDLGPHLRSARATAMGWIGLNTRRGPLADTRVRRALALALDRTVLAGRVRALDDRPSDALLPPGLADQPSPVLPDYAGLAMPQRLAEARELMRGAGYTGSKRARLGIGFPVPNPAAQKFYLAVSAMWRTIGVDAVLEPLEGRAYNAALQRAQFDVFSFNTFAQVPLATQFLDRFESRSSINYCGYRNAEYDRLFTAAQRAGEPAAVARALAGAERLLLRDLPVLPVYSATTHRLVAPRVRGWTDHSGPLRPSRYLALDGEDRQR